LSKILIQYEANADDCEAYDEDDGGYGNNKCPDKEGARALTLGLFLCGSGDGQTTRCLMMRH
jgi:hypothetical protein